MLTGLGAAAAVHLELGRRKAGEGDATPNPKSEPKDTFTLRDVFLWMTFAAIFSAIVSVAVRFIQGDGLSVH